MGLYVEGKVMIIIFAGITWSRFLSIVIVHVYRLLVDEASEHEIAITPVELVVVLLCQEVVSK